MKRSDFYLIVSSIYLASWADKWVCVLVGSVYAVLFLVHFLFLERDKD